MACRTVITVVLGLFVIVSGVACSDASPPGSAAATLQDAASQPIISANSPTQISQLETSAFASSSVGHDDRFTLPAKPSESAFAIASTESQAAVPEGDALKDFVRASGTSLTVNGVPRTFRGSNDFFLILRNFLTNDQVWQFFKLMSGSGINLVRTWAFVNGKDDPINGPYALQPTVGVFNEEGFRRLDSILAAAATYNVYVILPFVNYWPDLGGVQWYVDQVLGKGKPLEEFYTNTAVKQAFKNYIYKILTRTNTINSKKYTEDATILSLELANEPHTTDNWEKNHGIQPGSIVRAWISEMAAYVRSLDPNHMISTGEEGYRCGGSGWTEDCSKGVDFDQNLRDPNIAFATIHVYPSKWQVAPDKVEEFVNNFVQQRATIAHAAGKPIMLEESGIDTKEYSMSRDRYYSIMRAAAQKAGVVAMLPWQLVPWQLRADEGSGYDFDFGDPSSKLVTATLSYVVGPNTTQVPPAGAGGPSSQPQDMVRACRAEIMVGPEWDAGDSKTGAKLQIYLSSQSSETITAPYTVALAGPVAYRSAQSWSWNGTVDASGQITGTVTDSYQSLTPYGGNTASIGTVVLYKDPGAAKPSTLFINGIKCTVSAAASLGQ